MVFYLGSGKPPNLKKIDLNSNLQCAVPFERVQINVVSPFPTSSSGNKYLLVITDCFTKWVEAFPLKNVRAKTVAETFVNQVISTFRVPSEVHTDQGRNFDLRLFRELSHFLGIKKTRTTPFHSQLNGLVELQHQTINYLAKFEVPLDLLRGIPENEVNLSEESFVSKLRGKLNEIDGTRHLRFEPGNKVWLYNPRRISKKQRNKIVHLDRLASHHERHI
ncbi:hypothetical protein ACFW04_011955 [Cataglyphis niger]